MLSEYKANSKQKRGFGLDLDLEQEHVTYSMSNGSPLVSQESSMRANGKEWNNYSQDSC